VTHLLANEGENVAHYLIFIPGASGAGHGPLIDAGLGSLLRSDDSGPLAIAVDNGPKGSGVVYTWLGEEHEHSPRPGYYSDSQEWHESWNGKFWLGIEIGRPPQPADLSRRQQVPGKPLTMADGFTWLMPTLTLLPHKFVVNGDGEIAREIKDQYAEFFNVGMNIASEMMLQFGMIEEYRDRNPKAKIEDLEIKVTVKNGLELITRALNLNYRLNLEICTMLGMLDERATGAALIHFCELAEIRLVNDQKKSPEVMEVTIHAGSFT
jgi:hypothetical protein